MNRTDFDQAHVWHPYAPLYDDAPVYPVASANGVELTLENGHRLIDGMASWWCAIHGYNHPELNRALHEQSERFSHVMFGGLTHRPAVDLAKRLLELTPGNLQGVFFSDSGSVSVEVAIKMAIQYWQGRDRPEKRRLLSPRYGYHGDTFGAMSVCDPVNGMHRLFQGIVTEQLFVPPPKPGDRVDNDEDIDAVATALARHHHELAAMILEPIVQGAGGMRIYRPDYLRQVARLCREYGVLLIVDEIATGFGRTGTLFACEQAAVEPDILCLGKALTGGMMTLAATLVSSEVADGIEAGKPGVLMHGPTFMANPLACAVALASIDLLLTQDWQARVQTIEAGLEAGLAPCRDLSCVADVRIKGAIGVVELKAPGDLQGIQEELVDLGVWLRPFRNLVYTMPPFIIEPGQLDRITAAIRQVLGRRAQ
jgi:adenosylmethionine-8-amino-7-oxononanoate aminotransferase